ncbi:MAG TPA: phosphoglycolate phosphatase [Casimicrobiaceae bacterium]
MSESVPPHPPRRLSAAAVLFDLDGTLADTAGDLVAALNRVRADRGLDPVSIAALRAHASSGARGLLGAGLDLRPDDTGYRELRDAFLAYYEKGLADTTKLFDGIESMLATLEQRAIRWGIVTNKAERFTFPLLAALGLDQRASVVVCGDTTAHPKPHPAPLIHAADRLSIAVDQCVYVGDDLRDVQAGNAAGMATIVAKYGYLGETGACVGWPATGWIESPGELLAWIA